MTVAPVLSRSDPRLQEWFAEQQSMLGQMLECLNERKKHLDQIHEMQERERKRLKEAWARCTLCLALLSTVVVIFHGALLLF